MFLDLTSRLARVLLRLAREYGTRTPEGLRIERPVTHQELASRIGATRPRVSDAVQRLRRQRILGPDRRAIEILRPEALRQLAGWQD